MTGGIAGRYATALFELADDAGALEPVEKDLSDLGAIIEENADLRLMLTNPVFSREDQGRALSAILNKAGAHDLSRSFVGLVAQNRRLFVLPDMIKAFRALLADKRGEISAQVTSARALSEDQRKDLAATLKKALGQDVSLSLAVDPALLGGLVVKVGSRMVDSSIRTKLNTLKIAMKEAG